MKKSKDKRSASGTGTIRKKTVERAGRKYTYWEARYTEGRAPGSGKQIQRSISGKTQKEVVQKLNAVLAAIDAKTYTAPSKMTVGEWLDIWMENYLNGVKPRTAKLYISTVANYIKPALGTIKLEALNAHTIQNFYNRLGSERDGKPGLSPKTVKNIHGVLHKALQQAVKNMYIRFNPSDACELPRIERAEIRPLDEKEIGAFLKAIRGHQYEFLYFVTLFTGLRRGEVLGLKWDCVNFDSGTVSIKRQLQKVDGKSGGFCLVSPKNEKGRTITPAPFVMDVLKKQKEKQEELRLYAGVLWQGEDYVFTDEIGRHLSPSAVYHRYKRIVAEIGLPDARFHDLRHSYAVAALQSGDDIKTIQQNLGHHTAAFTLDVYGHVTEQMKRDSAERMEKFIKGVVS